MKSSNTVWHEVKVTRDARERRNGHKGVVIWFTGLSGSGKSTIAHALEEKLFGLGCHTYVFDGDNVRHGLCKDLGFSKEDRTENIRRIGEMVKLFVDAGTISLTAFISPFSEDRRSVAELVGDDRFVEVYCECPIEVCEARDVKQLYQRARRGEIPEFTGISSPYEVPLSPTVRVDTSRESVVECVKKVVATLRERGVFEGSFGVVAEMSSEKAEKRD